MTSAALLQSYNMASSTKESFSHKISQIQKELNYLDQIHGQRVIKKVLVDQMKANRRSLDRKMKHVIKKIAMWRSRSSQIAGSSRQHNSCCYATMQHLMTSFCNIWWHHLYDLHILDFEDTKVNIISQVVYNFSQI